MSDSYQISPPRMFTNLQCLSVDSYWLSFHTYKSKWSDVFKMLYYYINNKLTYLSKDETQDNIIDSIDNSNSILYYQVTCKEITVFIIHFTLHNLFTIAFCLSKVYSFIVYIYCKGKSSILASIVIFMLILLHKMQSIIGSWANNPKNDVFVLRTKIIKE